MIKIYALLTFFAFVNVAISQPVISDVVPNFGDQMVYHQNDGSPAPGSSGADVTWNFSGLTVDQYISNYTIVHPDDVDGSDQFPDATMVWQVDLGFAVLNSFNSFANNQFTEYGSLTSSSGINSGTVYDNPLVHFTYPVSYQDTGSDAYAGAVTTPAGDSPVTGESSYVVDGYGTIFTPYDTLEDVLRITTTKTENLSTFGITTTNNITDTYWYSTQYPMPVMITEKSVSSLMGAPMDSSSTVTVLVSYNGIPLGLNKFDVNNRLDVYPNPAENFVSFSADFKGLATLTIYSIEGKQLLKKTVANRDKIDVSRLNSGYYIIQIESNGSIYSRRSLIVR